MQKFHNENRSKRCSKPNINSLAHSWTSHLSKISACRVAALRVLQSWSSIFSVLPTTSYSNPNRTWDIWIRGTFQAITDNTRYQGVWTFHQFCTLKSTFQGKRVLIDYFAGSVSAPSDWEVSWRNFSNLISPLFALVPGLDMQPELTPTCHARLYDWQQLARPNWVIVVRCFYTIRNATTCTISVWEKSIFRKLSSLFPCCQESVMNCELKLKYWESSELAQTSRPRLIFPRKIYPAPQPSSAFLSRRFQMISLHFTHSLELKRSSWTFLMNLLKTHAWSYLIDSHEKLSCRMDRTGFSFDQSHYYSSDRQSGILH